jgi:hypothetical protein
MCSVPVLALPNFEESFEIEIDACDRVLELYCHKEAIPLHF